MCVSLISDVCNTLFRPGQIPVEALYADAAKYRAAVAADDEAPLVAVIFFFLVVFLPLAMIPSMVYHNLACIFLLFLIEPLSRRILIIHPSILTAGNGAEALLL